MRYVIQFRGIGRFWTFRVPWTVFEYLPDNSIPIESTFMTREKAEQFVMLKKLEW